MRRPYKLLSFALIGIIATSAAGDVGFDGVRGYVPNVESPLTPDHVSRGHNAAFEQALEILDGAEPPVRRSGSHPFGGAARAPGDPLLPQQAIEAVVVHPPLRVRYHCSEHHEGEYAFVFDALGQDCVVLEDGCTHTGDGSRNADYHAWGLPVLAPFDGTVETITVNRVVNTPGSLGESPATSVVFRRDDGVLVGYAHVDGIEVVQGERVTAGQPFARVSNNGMSSSPHLHVGAWQGETALQIRWDLSALGRLRGR